MAKLTQRDIRTKADEWALLADEIEKAETVREKRMKPLIERQNEELAAAVRPYDKKIEKLSTAFDALYEEIMGWLGSQPKAIKIESERAIAELRLETTTRVGPRVIDVQAFIAKATSRKKDPWGAVKVEVGKAERLLGPDDINAVSTRPETVSTERVASLDLK
jgi:hypothetical protein